jgi:hypothetical protein
MNVAALGYVVVKSQDLGSWRSFGEAMLGMSAHAFGNGLALKMDERAGRVFVAPGDADCYFASGWELRNESEFAPSSSGWLILASRSMPPRPRNWPCATSSTWSGSAIHRATGTN